MSDEIKTFAQFDALLATARAECAAMQLREPDDGAIASVVRQLDALYATTRDGRCPSQGEKDRYNFGLIASRELDNYPVADALYTLASYVIWRDEPPRTGAP